MIEASSEEVRESLQFFKKEEYDPNRKDHKKKMVIIPPLQIWFETGPYCNKRCSACYGSYGPHRNGFLKPDLVEKVMSQIDGTMISEFVLTDGEPFHDEQNLMDILDVVDGFPTDIMTNGCFADSYRKACKMMENLRKHKFTIKKQKAKLGGDFIRFSHLGVSADKYHGQMSFPRAVNVTRAYQDVFNDELDSYFLQAIAIAHMSIEPLDKETILVDKEIDEKLVKPLRQFYPDLEKHQDKDERAAHIYLVLGKGSANIVSYRMNPLGRAKNILNLEERSFDTSSITFIPEPVPYISIDHQGNVYYGSHMCREEGKKYGNVYDKELSQIIDGMMNDIIYQIHRCYGLRGMVALMKHYGIRNEFRAIDKCNLCKDMFSDVKNLDELRAVLRG